jgi:SNF2 family DNA or RNA helicase
MQKVLGDLFKEVLYFSNGMDGLNFYQSYREKIDLIITDITLPGMNGLEMVKAIKATHPDIPVVIVSAHNDTNFFLQAIDIGVEFFIVKPIDVNQVGIGKSRLKIFNGLMHLRQLALNPRLKDENYEGGSGKDDEISRMLVRAIDNGHKILLFSQFVGYLKNIAELLKESKIQYCYLDGSMDEKERAHQIDVFQNTPEIKIFLLSLRAGNSGLNLTAADYVFLADPWWNPFTMKQAEDRAHRIGQNKTVMSYKFITKNTIEEKILALQMKKTKLAESIIPDEDAVLTNLDFEELEELLN